MDDQRTNREDGMSDPGGRRRFSFSLRTFSNPHYRMAVWLGWNAHHVQQREAAIKYITSRWAGVLWNGKATLEADADNLAHSWREAVE
jgi:hypothetical protein